MPRPFIALVGLALALGLAPAVSAEQPAPGARYDGTNQSGDRVYVRVRADAAALAAYDVGSRMTCSDGKRRYLGLGSRGEPTVLVASDGSFQNIPVAGSFTYPNGLKGQAKTSFQGQFTAKDVATGTVTNTFTSKRVKCSSPPVPWTAYRDGTAQAPFRNAFMATGSYQAAGKGISFKQLETLAPARRITKLKFKWTVACASGREYRNTETYDPGELNRAGDTAVDLPGRNKFRLRGGYVVSERFRLQIGFKQSLNPAFYGVSGQFKMNATFRRRGKVVDSCRGTRKFSGRFVSGPANLF